MSTNAKRAIVGLIGGLGLIFLLLGAIGDVYRTTTGVIIMLACLLVSRWSDGEFLGTEKR